MLPRMLALPRRCVESAFRGGGGGRRHAENTEAGRDRASDNRRISSLLRRPFQPRRAAVPQFRGAEYDRRKKTVLRCSSSSAAVAAYACGQWSRLLTEDVHSAPSLRRMTGEQWEAVRAAETTKTETPLYIQCVLLGSNRRRIRSR